MSNINEEYIEEYIRSILPDRPNYLLHMEEYADKYHIPIIEPEVAQLLSVMIKMTKPKKVLEVGTAIGYSALVMAYSSNNTIKIDTIERREDMIEIANKNIIKTRYKDNIDIIPGDAIDILPKLDSKYDFVFLDASKGHYLEYFNYCVQLLNIGGTIVSDNVLYKGMVANDELVIRRKKTIVKRMRKYLSHISKLDGYTSCILPLGDGVAITYKEGSEIDE